MTRGGDRPGNLSSADLSVFVYPRQLSYHSESHHLPPPASPYTYIPHPPHPPTPKLLTSLQYSFNIPSIFLQHPFDIPSTFLQHSFNIPLIFLQYSFNFPFYHPLPFTIYTLQLFNSSTLPSFTSSTPIAQPPPTNGKKPITKLKTENSNNQPPIRTHQPPITNHQSPTTNHQSPPINHHPSITNHQSPTTNHQSPITNLEACHQAGNPAGAGFGFGRGNQLDQPPGHLHEAL